MTEGTNENRDVDWFGSLPFSIDVSRDELQHPTLSAGSELALAQSIVRAADRTYVIVLASLGTLAVVDGYASSVGLVIHPRSDDRYITLPAGVFRPESATIGIAELLRVSDSPRVLANPRTAEVLAEYKAPNDLVRAVSAGDIPGVQNAAVIVWKEGGRSMTLAHIVLDSEVQWSFEEGSRISFRAGDFLGLAGALVEAGRISKPGVRPNDQWDRSNDA